MDLPVERRQRILQMLEAQGSLRTTDLQRTLGVSLATVRRDLEALAQQGVIERIHGGALLRTLGTAFEPPFAVKSAVMLAEKERISKRAAEMVPVGATVVLDSGSTTCALARQLAGRRVTIIALDVAAAQAAAVGETEVLLVGGRVRNGLFSLVGPWTEETLKSLFGDFFFMGADAVDGSEITNSTVEEAAVKRIGIRIARKVVLLADHTKFGRRSLAQVCRLSDVSTIVTDSGIGPLEEALLEHVEQVFVV